MRGVKASAKDLTPAEAEVLARAAEGGFFDHLLPWGVRSTRTYDSVVVKASTLIGRTIPTAPPYWPDSWEPLRKAIIRRNARSDP